MSVSPAEVLLSTAQGPPRAELLQYNSPGCGGNLRSSAHAGKSSSHLRARGPECPYQHQRDRRVRPYGWEKALGLSWEGLGPVTSSSGHILGWQGWVRDSASNWGVWPVVPMISARMMPVRKSKVHCSTCRTAGPARNPCPSNRRACQSPWLFFLPSRRKSPRRDAHAAGNPRCQVGYIYWDASARGYGFVASSSHPQYLKYRSPSRKANTTRDNITPFCLPGHQLPSITQHPTQQKNHSTSTSTHSTPGRPSPVA